MSTAQRRVLITGANSGIGYFTALELAKQGDHVTLACRNREKADDAAQKISAEAPDGTVDTTILDLADLASVRACAQSAPDRLDVLINNAGVMMPPQRTETADGFESQFGTNHLGHFALTGLLLPKLRAAHSAKVVTVSSVAHKQRPRLDFDDLQARENYGSHRAYANSKLSNLLFALEFQRRLDNAGIPITSTAAHPGFSNTALYTSPDGFGGVKLASSLAPTVLRLVGQSADAGAKPTLYALENGEPGSYWGPKMLFESVGAPARAKVSRMAQNAELAQKLWTASEKLTGVTYNFD